MPCEAMLPPTPAKPQAKPPRGSNACRGKTGLPKPRASPAQAQRWSSRPRLLLRLLLRLALLLLLLLQRAATTTTTTEASRVAARWTVLLRRRPRRPRQQRRPWQRLALASRQPNRRAQWRPRRRAGTAAGPRRVRHAARTKRGAARERPGTGARPRRTAQRRRPSRRRLRRHCRSQGLRRQTGAGTAARVSQRGAAKAARVAGARPGRPPSPLVRLRRVPRSACPRPPDQPPRGQSTAGHLRGGAAREERAGGDARRDGAAPGAEGGGGGGRGATCRWHCKSRLRQRASGAFASAGGRAVLARRPRRGRRRWAVSSRPVNAPWRPAGRGRDGSGSTARGGGWPPPRTPGLAAQSRPPGRGHALARAPRSIGACPRTLWRLRRPFCS